ncbi:M81 family metallopeptidase, partial [bacterium]|nr:M81 family metallopeptidase [bacterium]
MSNKTKRSSGKSSFFRERDIFKIKAVWIIVILLLVGFVFGSMGVPEEGKNLRIAVARFSHETCTFCPKPTTIKDWEYYGPPTRDIIDSDRGYIGGFKNMCEEYGGIELVGILSPRGARGGSSGSWITKEAFDKYTSLIAGDLKQAGPFDGVFLSLHGAM